MTTTGINCTRGGASGPQPYRLPPGRRAAFAGSRGCLGGSRGHHGGLANPAQAGASVPTGSPIAVAKAGGQRVEVLSLRTETDQVFQNPDAPPTYRVTPR
jgi:hypothetical protein